MLAGRLVAESISRASACANSGRSNSANGNMLTGAGRTLVYDGENRIVSATVAAGVTAYAYGPDGARLTTVFTPHRPPGMPPGR